MCLAIPSKVVAIHKESNMVTLDTMGVTREASLDLMQEEVHVGEYVLLHIGYVMGKIDAKEAQLSLEAYAEILKSIEEEEAKL